ncbi:MAG: hypothetical protein IJC99_02885 [Clostridia bacterium]|nr:hypothetical protein [Clostridia bacterium]
MEEKRKRPWSFHKERPDLEAEDATPTLAYFFKLLWRKAGKLLTLNLMMVVRVLPLVAALLIYFFGATTPTVGNPAYTALMGTYLASGSPAATALLPLYNLPLNMPTLTPWRLVIIIILVAFTVITWGWQQVGATYNLRSLVRGDSCFLWSDYFYAIRRNLKQALIFGLIDVLVTVVLVADIVFLLPLAGQFGIGLMYGFIIALAIIYFVMRFYIYPMMITFDLSIKKLFKNALIFTMLGIKRNIVALIGVVLIIVLNFFSIIWGLSIGLSVTLILPFFYLTALIGFIGTYMAYPVIQRYMIDPYTAAKPADDSDDADATPQADG